MFLPYCLRNRLGLNLRRLVAEGFPPPEAHPNKRTSPAGSNESAGLLNPVSHPKANSDEPALSMAMPLPDLPVAMLELAGQIVANLNAMAISSKG